MTKEELKKLLNTIAQRDLEDDADIFDHPCSVAVRAIDKCFEDIETLRTVAPKRRGSKRVQMLTGLSYDPTW